MDLAETLEDLRAQRGWTQAQAAAHVGVSDRTWRKWVGQGQGRNFNAPSPEHRAKIERTFGVTLPTDPDQPTPAATTSGPVPAPKDGDTLADYLRTAMAARGLDSVSDLRHRLEVAYETAASLLAGTAAPSNRTLERVAERLGLPLNLLHRLAGQATIGTPWTPPVDSEMLTAEERAALGQLIKLMVAGRRPVTPPASRNGNGPDTDEASGPS